MGVKERPRVHATWMQHCLLASADDFDVILTDMVLVECFVAGATHRFGNSQPEAIVANF